MSEAAINLLHTTEEWRIYRFVLPSTRTLTDHKQFKAVQHENQAAMALYTKPGKGEKRDQYVQKRLKLCKSWGGPVVSVEELCSILKSYPDQNKVIVCSELIYFRESHKSEQSRIF